MELLGLQLQELGHCNCAEQSPSRNANIGSSSSIVIGSAMQG